MKHLIIIVAAFFISFATNAQTGVLTGKVISNVNNQPLTGVTIYSQAKKISTTSDVEGNFTLKLPAGSHELNFSFTGYQTKKSTI